MKRIGILGAGFVGGGLAKRFVELGYEVKIANSKSPETLRQLEISTGAKAYEAIDAITDVDFAIIAIPNGQVPNLSRTLQGRLNSVPIVIDSGNYYPSRDGKIVEIEQGMPETSWVSRQLSVPVVKAFNNATADSLAFSGKPKGSVNRIALPVSADNAGDRANVMKLVDELGFDPYDAGPLEHSWRQQPGQPAYCPDPNIKQLPTLLARANRESAPKNRDRVIGLMEKLPPSFPAQDLVRTARVSAGLDVLNLRSWLSVAHFVSASYLPIK